MVLPLYAVTLFVSAFLLFLVQPMIGKMILPRLGGTPQVWNTCMVFFQSALLAGYAYTHTVTTRLTARRQILVHCIVLFVPLAILLPPLGPFIVSGFEPPPGGNPIAYTLYFLTLVVGLPFIVVSTSAPLLQRWFAYSGHATAKDPYFLYGASNLGSMLALLFYPFMLEPTLALRSQAWTWAGGYMLFTVFVLVCAYSIWKLAPAVKLAPATETPPSEIPLPPAPEPATSVKAGPPPGVARGSARKKGIKLQSKRPYKVAAASPVHQPRPDVMTPWRRLRWVLLAAAPSSMMLGAISFISTDLSPIAMVWVLPLALYLLTFILVFLRYPVPWTGLPHTIMIWVQPFLIIFLCLIFAGVISDRPEMWRTTLITLVAFFFTAMVCHGELARDRPSTRHLTEFYLWMSFGGMLGGVFNGLAAPLLFTGVAEYPIALVVACLLRPQQKQAGWTDDFLTSAFTGITDWCRDTGQKLGQIPLLNFLLIVLLGGGILAGCVWLFNDSMETSKVVTAATLGIALVIIITVIALRFSPGNTVSFFLDGFYPLLLMCCAAFVFFNAGYNWGWAKGVLLRGDLKENPLFRVVGISEAPVPYLFRFLGENWLHWAYNFLVYVVPLIVAVFFCTRPLRYGLAIGAFLLAHQLITSREDRAMYAGRSYFGVLRVYLEKTGDRWGALTDEELEILKLSEEDKKKIGYAVEKQTFYIPPSTYLMHGTTHHGLNYQLPKNLRRLATTYYHRMGPTGKVMERLNWFPGPQNTYWADARLPAALTALGGSTMGAGNLPIGQLACAWSEPPYATVGLGTGTMASYGRPFQHVTFYEIDNTIRSFHLPPYAERGPFFNYLQDAIDRGVALEVIMGDARQSMKEDRQGQLYLKDRKRQGRLNPNREGYYRVIELDAFSSDAIPVHLITREAIEMYFKKLSEQGVLCVHTSNRHVDLVTPVVDLATDLNLAYRVGKDDGGDPREGRDVSGYRGHFGQEYVMLAKKKEYLPSGESVPLSESWSRRLTERQAETAQPVTSVLTQKQYMIWYTPDPAGKRVWTDDYSNLAGAMRETLARRIFIYLFLGIGVFVVLVILISKNYQPSRGS